MWYNSSCYTHGHGGVLLFRQRRRSTNEIVGQDAPRSRTYVPAVCVAATAHVSYEGHFAMGRKCSQCGGSGPFSKSKYSPDGLYSICKPCQSAKRKDRWRNDPEYRERVKAANEKWRQNNREKHNARVRRWRRNNPEKHLESKRRWRKRYPDKAHAADRRKLKRRKQNNPEGYRRERRMAMRRRRARKANAEGDFTAQQFRRLCDRYDNQCLCCGRKDVELTADHVVPLSWGGSNDISNIQPLCRKCNARKGDRRDTDYRRKGGIKRWIQKKLF